MKSFRTRWKEFKQMRAGGVFFTRAKNYFLKKTKYREPNARQKFLTLAEEEGHFKTVCKLRRKLKKTCDRLEKHIRETDEKLEHVASGCIFIFWWQGMENAPEIVRMCYQSVLDRLSPSREIVLLTKDNYRDYVKIPPRIEELLQKKVIPIQYLSDILRLQLLIEHGGTWMDATVLCTGDVPSYMFSSPLFMPGDIWFIHADSNNKILRMMYGLLLAYFEKHNVLCDYLLTLDMMELASERFSKEWGQMPPCENQNMLVMQRRMGTPFEENSFDAILKNAPIHKLNWRYTENIEQSGGGVYILQVKRALSRMGGRQCLRI